MVTMETHGMYLTGLIDGSDKQQNGIKIKERRTRLRETDSDVCCFDISSIKKMYILTGGKGYYCSKTLYKLREVAS